MGRLYSIKKALQATNATLLTALWEHTQLDVLRCFKAAVGE